MVKVGVTGGIGSGKSTLCAVWETLGAAVYYADDAAKKLMITDQKLISDLKAAFGEETYYPDGSLNKEHLIREAFEKGEVEKLNRLVHPVVAKDFQTFVEKAEADEKEIAAKEAALLLIGGRPEELDLIVLVLSDKKKRMERVIKRDGVSFSEVENRDNKQPDFGLLTHLADHLVTNDGTLEELKNKAEKLYYELQKSELTD